MLVTNRCSFPLLAFGWADSFGYADDILIPVGESREVDGPYVGEMGGGSCHVALIGSLTFQERPSDDIGFWEIARNVPACLRAGDRGITVRHHEDEPEKEVILWRKMKVDSEDFHDDDV